jgi:hypothetical protein
MSANTIWHGGESDFPAGGSGRQKLGHAVKCAAMAASLDEWQPWQFRLDHNHVELSADASPASADPDGRELMVRCGTALFHLKLALKRFGCLGRVELFPEFGQPGLVARVHCGFSPDCGAQEVALFEAMSRNPNSSAAWNQAPVSESLFGRFEGAMAGEKAWLEFSQCKSSRNRLLEFAEFGVKAPVTGNPPETSPGSSRVAQWTKPLLTFIVRTGDSGQVSVEPAGPRAEQMEMLAVIKTKTDDKHGWLATGQALARVRLQARVSEISLQVFDQAFRSRYVREELRTSIGHKGFAQVLIGFGSHPAAWADTSLAQQAAIREDAPDTAFPSRSRTGG